MDGGQVVSVHLTDPALGPADPIPERGRTRYREYWEAEIMCPIVRQAIMRYPRWDAFDPFPPRVYVEYLYNGKTFFVALNRHRREKRGHMYAKVVRNPKQAIWRRKREEDRLQKEHRLKQETWFLYHGDRADEDENVVVFRKSKRSVAARKKARPIKTRDEWRTNLKKPKEYAKDRPAVEIQPSLRYPNKELTNHEPVKMIDKREVPPKQPLTSKLRSSGLGYPRAEDTRA